MNELELVVERLFARHLGLPQSVREYHVGGCRILRCQNVLRRTLDLAITSFANHELAKSPSPDLNGYRSRS